MAVRKSQEPVKWDPDGRGWNIDLENMGPNSPPPHVSPVWEKTPVEASMPSESEFVPYSPIHGPIPSYGNLPRLSKRSGLRANALLDSVQRLPFGSVDMQTVLYEIVLLEHQIEISTRENRALAKRNAALKRQVDLQEALIRGFCARVAQSKAPTE